jgi:valyl-tRNA synthetase
MNGYNVFYPMGYDDNGLPTERLVEKRLRITAAQVGRSAFIEKCLQISEEAEQEYQNLWHRVGLSVDWRYSYRTIDSRSRRISQFSFLELYRQGLAYRKEAPAIWCPECQTSIAQAELNDLERQSEFFDLVFYLESGERLIIATTRPELLPACVAVFVHPSDERYRGFVGLNVRVPLFDQLVPILSDPAADPEKGTGAVMCCTFGDTTDVAWWHNHHLPLIQAIDRTGKMTDAAGEFAGLTTQVARQKIVARLEAEDLIIGHLPTTQSVRVHERCDTPVEYILVSQWFINVLEFKERFLEAGTQVHWVPAHMAARFHAWVENLNWDWCISRQRYFGVPFPVWYCKNCSEVMVAYKEQLPVDPLADSPLTPCPRCGGSEYSPEMDVFDTWATSSMSPQIVGNWLDDQDQSLYSKVFPFTLRPQGHEIIRTWAFYSIVKSGFHFDSLPWKNVLISGWGLAGEGLGKISKSRGGGPMPPLEMIEKYSADAVRYWAASSSPGRDSIINEEKIQAGAKLVTKLWNVARFSERFLDGYMPGLRLSDCSPADRWILSKLANLIQRVTASFEQYDYAAAKYDAETFFWTDLADNYLEMCKQRLYTGQGPGFEAARGTLYFTLLTIIKLFAPLLPFVTEEIYLGLFALTDGSPSVHISRWPEADPTWDDAQAELVGTLLVEAATAVRRFKSERNLSLGTELSAVKLAVGDDSLGGMDGIQLKDVLLHASQDLISITRARQIEVISQAPGDPLNLNPGGRIGVVVEL